MMSWFCDGEEESEQTVIVTYVIRGAPSITGRLTRQRRQQELADLDFSDLPRQNYEIAAASFRVLDM